MTWSRAVAGGRWARVGSAALATIAAAVLAQPAPAAVGDLGLGVCLQDAGSAMTPDPECVTAGARNFPGVALSPDDRQAYVASADGLVAFSRDPATGALTSLQCLERPAAGTPCANAPGLNPERVAVSPDGTSVYVSGGGTLVHLVRDPATGVLAFGGCIDDEDENPEPACTNVPGMYSARAVAVSPDASHVYVGSITDAAVVAFSRDRVSGGLAFIQCLQDKNSASEIEAQCGDVDGLDDVTDLEVSRDGGSVLAAGRDTGAVINLHRDRALGVLTAAGCVRDDDANEISGCATHPALDSAYAVAFSPDGTSAYAGSGGDDALVAFERDPSTGALAVAACFEDDGVSVDVPSCAEVPGLASVSSISVAADARTVYVGSRDDAVISAFSRDPASRTLAFSNCVDDDDSNQTGAACPGVPGLDELSELASTADGRGLVAGTLDSSLLGFSREPDAAGPTVVLNAKKRQRVAARAKRSGKVTVTASCLDELCTSLQLTGKLRAKVKGKRKPKQAKYTAVSADRLHAGQPAQLTLKPTRKAKRLLQNGRRAKVSVTAFATDLLGNEGRASAKVKLNRPKRR